MDQKIVAPTKAEESSQEGWKLSITMHDIISEETSAQREVQLDAKVPLETIEGFRHEGFAVFPHVLSKQLVDQLNQELEEVLRGQYNTGQSPDKAPKKIKVPMHKNDGAKAAPLGFTGNHQNVKVMQVINVHKSNKLFRALATSTALGKLVSELAGWERFGGTRLAQDQIWAKPPSAAALSFHRDSPYFFFTPRDEVVTVWVALDDMDAEIGPLQYVCGSHKWGEGRTGTSNQFFDSRSGGMALLRSAAEREGGNPDDLQIVSMAGLKAGGISIHNGKTWHGSGPNTSRTRPRRGLGLHFVPANARFTSEAIYSQLWKPYVEFREDPEKDELPEDDFPLTWKAAGCDEILQESVSIHNV